MNLCFGGARRRLLARGISFGADCRCGASDGERPIFTKIRAATATGLALSAAKVTYGHEQAERLTITVTSRHSGTPGGKVTIKTGKTTVCTITLAAGKGHCTLTARKLRAGTYTLIAAYPGSRDFTGSASAKKTLTVAK